MAAFRRQVDGSMRQEPWKLELEKAIEEQDWNRLRRLAGAQPAKTLRHLTARLYASEDGSRQKVVGALGAIAGEPGILSDEKIRELLRRYFWWLNDESGAVPLGIPEAIGAILAARTEFQQEFLPLLCSLAYNPDLLQTGPIERGVFWALGHIGRPAAMCSPDTVRAIVDAAQRHPDRETQITAAWALSRFEE
jgi:methylated-DNA-[protein]-cysteine S-methyltransferase